MNQKNSKSAVLWVHLDADFIEAVEAFGFESQQHFFRQAAHSLCEAYRNKDKIEWPLKIEVRQRAL